MGLEIPKEVLEKAKRATELEGLIQLKEELWAADICPTEEVIKEYDRLIAEIEELMVLYPQMKNPKSLENHLAEVKRKRSHYVNLGAMEER